MQFCACVEKKESGLCFHQTAGVCTVSVCVVFFGYLLNVKMFLFSGMQWKSECVFAKALMSTSRDGRDPACVSL